MIPDSISLRLSASTVMICRIGYFASLEGSVPSIAGRIAWEIDLRMSSASEWRRRNVLTWSLVLERLTSSSVRTFLTSSKSFAAAWITSELVRGSGMTRIRGAMPPLSGVAVVK